MICIFSLPTHWAGIRELFPERFAEVEGDDRIPSFTLDSKKALAEYVGNAKSCVCRDDPRALSQLVSGEFSVADVEQRPEWTMPAGAFHGAAGGCDDVEMNRRMLIIRIRHYGGKRKWPEK